MEKRFGAAFEDHAGARPRAWAAVTAAPAAMAAASSARPRGRISYALLTAVTSSMAALTILDSDYKIDLVLTEGDPITRHRGRGERE